MTVKLYGYLAAGLLLVVAVLFIWWGVFVRPAELERQRDAARGQAAVSTGEAGAARDAGAIVAGNAGRAAQTEREIDRAVEDIYSVPEGQRDGAAIAALCLRPSYRDNPSCVGLRELRSR